MADSDFFDIDKYSPVDEGSGTYVDLSDNLANRGYNISFYHLASGQSVFFKAFIETFNDTYSPDWAAETVYGRADPIYTFKNTTRRISLAFKVPAATAGEAYENLAKVQKLTQFLYPAYADVNNANTISQAPLVRLRVINFTQVAESIDTSQSAKQLYDSYSASSEASSGLLGVISSTTVNFNLENTDIGVIERPDGVVLSKMLNINLDFGVVHEHTVGWILDEGTGEYTFAKAGFPYGAPLEGNVDASAVNAGAALVGGFEEAVEEATQAAEDTGEALYDSFMTTVNSVLESC